jgi:peptidoglycan/xylan/chitin deacetylase (PgdA/CDA1 family)
MTFRSAGLVIYFALFNAAGATDCAYNAEKSMLSRVVAVDAANGAFEENNNGSVSFPSRPLVLKDKEIVLTFDQGPHPANTEHILNSLDRFCAKAVFFFAGSAALANPGMVREVARHGHTLAAGPWSASADLASLPLEEAKLEIEKGLSAVSKAAGGPVAPFFRLAGAAPAPSLLAYLKERGVSLWPYDIASGDNEAGISAVKLFNQTVAKLHEKGKGVVQFHDTRKVTVDMLDDILLTAKQSGFKVVQPVPAANFAPKEEYLAALPRPGLETRAPARASQSLAEEAKRKVRAQGSDDPQARSPVRKRRQDD